jgi:S1-C subfamily serine protease
VDAVNRIVPVDSQRKDHQPGLGLELAEEQIASGVLILDVMSGGPAAKAGIRDTA